MPKINRFFGKGASGKDEKPPNTNDEPSVDPAAASPPNDPPETTAVNHSLESATASVSTDTTAVSTGLENSTASNTAGKPANEVDKKAASDKTNKTANTGANNSVKNKDKDPRRFLNESRRALSDFPSTFRRGVEQTVNAPVEATKAAFQTGKEDKREGANTIRGKMKAVMRGERRIHYQDPIVDNSPIRSSEVFTISDVLRADQDGMSFPRRMFDLDTGDLVDVTEMGAIDRYCMLSHCWNGDELNYGRVEKARRSAEPGLDDVRAVLRSCDQATQEAYTAYRDRLQQSQDEEKKGKTDTVTTEDDRPVGVPEVREYLKTYTRYLELDKNRADKKRDLNKARREAAEAEIDAEHFSDLCKLVPIDQGQWDAPKLRLVAAKRDEDLADKKFNKATQEYADIRDDHEIIQRQRSLYFAVEGLLRALEQRRSARKLKSAFDRAKELFQKMPFPKTGCKYIWLDNCCINKPDTGELTESLASMGEWYANAAFCLVHLDNDRSPNDWLDEWDLWRREKGDSGVSEKPPNPEKPDDSANTLDDFLELAKRKNKHEDKSEDESDIRWATRGWTLQELVLSKMTYYVGPDWMPLSRNVQSLGQYYHLSPFVIASNPDVLSSTYVESEESKRLIDGLPSVTTANKNEVQLPENNLQNTEDRTRINSAHVSKTIIDILQEIGYLVPDGLDRESARSRIKLSIQATVAYLADYDSDSHAFKVLARLVVLYSGSSKSVQVPGKPDKSEKPDANWRKTAEKAIETLLIVLAKAEIKAIQDDRTYIAKFSNIADLVSWSEGTVTNRFSAHSVMYLASKRNVAKIVDKAYSLMGILGVRFPAFHAEGLTKALSRLMDEVVISSNDVSLFNWSGKHCGSPVRGRSLYASNIRGFEANFSPSKRFQTSRDLHMLHRRYVKNEGEKSNDVLSVLNKVIAWAMKASISYETVDLLKELSKHVLNADYKRLHEKLTTEFRQLTSELVASAEKSAKGDGNVPEARPTVEANTTATSQPADQGVPSNTAEYAENSRQSELGVDSSENAATEYRALDASQEPATPTSSISLEDQAQSQRKETDTTSFSSLGSKFKTKVKTQAVGLTQFNKPDPPAAQPEQETARKGDTTSKTSKQPTPEERLREHIEIFLEKKAPKNDGNTSAPINTSKSTSTDEEPKSDVDRDRPITCPNPIIVSGAGIQGVFDIQRVVVSMLDERELRLRIRNALSDYEMIDGWCTISTGLARIMVSFSCEKHILAQQMDLDYMIRNTVLSDPDKSSGDNQPDSWSAQSSTDTAHSSIKADSSSTQLNPDKAHSSINPDGSPTQSSTETAHPSDGPDSAQGNVPDTTPTELKPPSTPANPKRQDNDNRPREKRNIHRMLDYVTAPNLNEVAGEWVLARFSDSPNAKWFLCRLELGSSHQYYARRIPTDDFSFDHAIPEEQLVDYWRGFLREKKALLAETLRDVASRNKSANYVKFLTADLSRKFSGDKRDEDEIAAASTIKQAKVKVEAEISVPLAASADNAVAKEQILAAVQVSEAAVDETSGAAEGGETKPDAGTGGAAKPNEHTEKEKKYAKLSTSRQLLRLIWWSIYMHAHGGWADHVLRFLDEKALANVPPRLQSAVLAFHQSKPLLPRMYHAGKDVHFF